MPVFISGSISIKNLPNSVKSSIDSIASQERAILVGDARGIDSLVQDYCLEIGYHNVTVYSIYLTARYKHDIFEQQFIEVGHHSINERLRQTFKDAAMTRDSRYNLIVWDGKSKGSLNNIYRAIHEKKQVKVFSIPIDKYISVKKEEDINLLMENMDKKRIIH